MEIISYNLIDAELRNFEITTKGGEMLESNKQIWQSIGFKQTDNALFFPAPNALVPLRFAKFMNKRKVTFVDTNDINVGTLISLAADLKLSNVTVKLASPNGKFPISDSAFDVVYSDLGFSSFLQDHRIDIDALTKELVRILKPGGKLAALDENGAPVMYPCPPEIQSIRAKIDAPRADKLVMGRRIYSVFKTNGLKNTKLTGYSRFVTGDDRELMESELARRIASMDSYNFEGQSSMKGTVVPQEAEKYKAWLKSQMSNDSFLIQFNQILAVGEK
ncbi:MAG: methyltransferase domain-containing protein [archaeon]|nr:methyltransferase domain-containing protein [archaeon]